MQKTKVRIVLSLVLALCVGLVPVLSQTGTASAADYYADITATSGTELLGQLHDLITTTHTHYTSYAECGNASSTQYVYQSDPGSNSSSLMEFYTQQDISRTSFDVSGGWNREHVWPKANSNGLWTSTVGGGADLHHVRPAEKDLNNARGNLKYGEVSNGTPKYASGTKALGGYANSTTFEPLDNVKGDIARILFYVYTHYNTYSNVGGTTNGSGSSSYFGTLNFTNNVTAGSESAAIEMLLRWNQNDPVDQIEITRNNAVAKVTGNRNPFIDNENYADAIWGNKPVGDTSLKRLTVSPASVTLAVGSTTTLNVEKTPSTASASLEWSSSAASVATVSNTGVVTAKAAGSAIITVTDSATSISASATVTVKEITGIAISGTPTKTSYTEGETFAPAGLTVTATYSDNSTSNVALSDCDWLDGTTGNATLSAGTTTVICRYGNIPPQTVVGLTVSADPNAVYPVDMTDLQENTPYKLAVNNVGLGKKVFMTSQVGEQYYLGITDNLQNAPDLFVEKATGGFYLYFENGSQKNYVNIVLSGNYVNLGTGTSDHTLWYYDADNKCIGTDVSGKGEYYLGAFNSISSVRPSSISRITGENAANIGVTQYLAYLCTTQNTPAKPVSSVVLNKTELSLLVGSFETLLATTVGEGTLEWTSSAPLVASVAEGKVTALSEGVAIITVTFDGVSAQCVVAVSHSVSLDKESVTLNVDETSTLAATATGDVTWVSSNPSVATVSNGVVTAVAEGIATITALCGNAVATCTVTVAPAGGGEVGESGEITITTESFASLTGGYGFFNWSVDGVSGIAYIYGGSADKMQFNVNKASYYVASTTATPAGITSVTVVGSGTDRDWELLTSSTAYGQTNNYPTSGNSHGTKTVTEEGVTWTLDGSDIYFTLNYKLEADKGAAYITQIKVVYGNATETPNPEDSVEIDKTTLSLEVGETGKLVASNASGTPVWRSSDITVATVAQDGTVTAVGGGVATITVSCGSASQSCTVTVTEDPEVTLDRETVEMEAAQIVVLKAFTKGEATLSWASSNQAVATVENGVVTAVAAGTATITVTFGTAKATCTVTVTAPTVADAVILNKVQISLEVGQTETLIPSANGNVSWTSSNETVATVANGKVTAVAAGTATITATCGTAKATCDVTVTAPVVPDSVTLDKGTLSLEVGETATLVATASGDVSWSSSNEAVATVANGKVTAVAVGTATITATCGTAKATCEVTVTAPVVPDSVTLDNGTLSLEVGETATLVATASGDVSWSSSNEAVATVANGKVTAVAAGTATITATCGTAKAICEVTVTAPAVVPEKIVLKSTSLTLSVGQSATIEVEKGTDIVWSSSDSTIAAVTQNGNVAALAAGNVTITATNSVSLATCIVRVEADSVTINIYDVELKVGGEITLTALSNKDVVWTSSDETVATVDGGKVKALKAGIVTITAAGGTAKAICTIKVQPSFLNEFKTAVLEISNATTQQQKFDAIKHALDLYQKLDSEEKALASAEYMTLQGAIGSYNSAVTAQNEEMRSAVESALSGLALMSAALAALLYLLKQRQL